MKALPCISLWLILLTLLLPAPLAAAKADIDGFKGMRWGSYLTDLQQTKKLVLTKEGGKSGGSLHALENEELRYGKATLTGIHCSFAKERLNGVILLFSGNKNFAAVKAEAFAKFGESTKIEQSGEEMYNWPGTVTSIVLSYNRKNQSGFLFMKAKKMPPPSKVADKRKAASPAAVATAPDRTPPPVVPQTRPATNPADLETALDQAPPLPQPEPAAEAVTPEMQVLIDRDQALTQLCWETAGPAADAACVQMRENIERLRAMGLCMTPDAQGRSGTEVIWRRCGTAAAAPTPPAPPAGSSSVPGAAPPAVPEVAPPAVPEATPAPQAGEANSQRCQRVGELFATAAQMRDNGLEPQAAEEELIWRVDSQTPGITIERIRETVELVYFDQEYAQARDEQLARRVSDRCLSGRGPYAQPLP